MGSPLVQGRRIGLRTVMVYRPKPFKECVLGSSHGNLPGNCSEGFMT